MMQYPKTTKSLAAVQYANQSLSEISEALHAALKHIEMAKDALSECNGYGTLACIEHLTDALAPVNALTGSAKHILMKAAQAQE